MKRARHDRRPLLMLIGLATLAGVALVLSACGSSGGTTTVTAGQEANEGAQVFASAGCGNCHTFKAAGSNGTSGPNLDKYLEPDDNKAGIDEMIVDPNAEIAEGYKANVMPQNFGKTLTSEEVKQLVDFLYNNSPASQTQQGEQAEKDQSGK